MVYRMLVFWTQSLPLRPEGWKTTETSGASAGAWRVLEEGKSSVPDGRFKRPFYPHVKAVRIYFDLTAPRPTCRTFALGSCMCQYNAFKSYLKHVLKHKLREFKPQPSLRRTHGRASSSHSYILPRRPKRWHRGWALEASCLQRSRMPILSSEVHILLPRSTSGPVPAQEEARWRTHRRRDPATTRSNHSPHSQTRRQKRAR
jgi:hypothetical protein